MDLRKVTPKETVELRRDVLRAGRSDLPLDDGSAAYGLGVFMDGRLIATGNVRPEVPDWRPEPGAWRIRGMATDPDHRGSGAGGLILGGLRDHAVANGATLVWCHARVPARRFYERHGFESYGDPWFEPPPFGPHVVMHRVVGPTRA